MELTAETFFFSTIVHASLYTLYLISLAFALRWLLFKEEGWILKNRTEVNWFMIATTTLIFVFSTGAMVNSALQLVFSRSEINHGMVIKRLVISDSVIEAVAFFIIDAVLIFRCWMVYQRSWRAVCIPVMLWLANIVLMVLFAVYAAKSFKDHTQYDFLQEAEVFYCCNFVTNLYTTSAIVYRVWDVADENNNKSSFLYRVARIVAETGILYASSSLAVVVAAFLMSKSPVAFFVCNAINFSMAGITFNLLLIRVGQLRADVEMDICAITPEAKENVVLSTLQFGVSSIPVDNSTFDLESTYHGHSADTAFKKNEDVTLT